MSEQYYIKAVELDLEFRCGCKIHMRAMDEEHPEPEFDFCVVHNDLKPAMWSVRFMDENNVEREGERSWG